MTLRPVFDAIQRVEEVLLAGSILLIAALTCLNVFTRSVLGFSLASAEELSQFLMLVVTFVGLSYAASRGRHIRMTALYDQLDRRWQKLVMITTSASTSLMLGVLALYALAYVDTLRVLGTVSPALQVPLYLVYLAAPFGLGLGAIQYALTTVRNWTEEEVYRAWDVPDRYDEPVQPGI